MVKENKIAIILASTTLLFSILMMIVSSAVSGNSSNKFDLSLVSDFNVGNTHYYNGFGSSKTSVKFEGEMDSDIYNFLLIVNRHNKVLNDIGSVTSTAKLAQANMFDINEQPVGEKIELDYLTYELLIECKTLFEYSSGLFDINAGMMFDAVKEAISKYNTTSENNPLDLSPYTTKNRWGSDFDAALLLEQVDGKYYATRKHKDTKLDLGGYLKGYFVEYIRWQVPAGKEVFVNSGSSSMSYIGSNQKNVILGAPRIGDNFVCGGGVYTGCPGEWQNTNNFHMATSGDTQQYYIDTNKNRVHHLVNPINGEMKQNKGLLSVLTTDSAKYLDAISSILFIADESDLESLIDKFKNIDMDIVHMKLNQAEDDYEDIQYIKSTSENRFVVNSRFKGVT